MPVASSEVIGAALGACVAYIPDPINMGVPPGIPPKDDISTQLQLTTFVLLLQKWPSVYHDKSQYIYTLLSQIAEFILPCYVPCAHREAALLIVFPSSRLLTHLPPPVL